VQARRLACMGARKKHSATHVGSFVDVTSDAGSIPAASTIFARLRRAMERMTAGSRPFGTRRPPPPPFYFPRASGAL
jgi:hypothetical protein